MAAPTQPDPAPLAAVTTNAADPTDRHRKPAFEPRRRYTYTERYSLRCCNVQSCGAGVLSARLWDMDDPSQDIQVRALAPGSCAHLRALHLALSLPPPATGASPAPAVADLLADARAGRVNLDACFGAYRGDTLLSACAAAESAGRAALVLVPRQAPDAKDRQALAAALLALHKSASNKGLRLLQVLLDSASSGVDRALSQAGFRRLTQLVYLSREASDGAPQPAGASDLEWLSYQPDRECLFLEALEASYTQSMDCPELTGLRDTSDVLAGHAAVGEFEASLWWVAMRGGSPVGVLLLTAIRHTSVVEVVYMGVAQVARGTGVADALLGRATALVRSRSAKSLALAVDARNTPARRLYARWGFRHIGAREAWIASLGQSGGCDQRDATSARAGLPG